MQYAVGSRQCLIGGTSAHSLPTAYCLLPTRLPTAYRLLPTRCAAFTLAELLIVIALIVLLVAMAVPAFNFITGSRSVDGAQNTIAAFLGRARAEAIGLQEIRGVFFFLDPRTDRINMTLVHAVATPVPNPPPGDLTSKVEVWLDLVSDAEFLPLPKGVGLQLIDDCNVDTTTNPATRKDDGYLGFNYRMENQAQPDTHTWYGGVILFDGAGRLVSKRYGFATNGTQMGDLLYRPPGDLNPLTTPVPHAAPFGYDPVSSTLYLLRSQFGFILFDNEAFREAAPKAPGTPYRVEHDSQIVNSIFAVLEIPKENWLDNNSTPLLVNRYNGTLVKGE